MKKLALLFIGIIAYCAMSCGNSTTACGTDCDTVDTVSVDTVDTVCVDTVAVDSICMD